MNDAGLPFRAVSSSSSSSLQGKLQLENVNSLFYKVFTFVPFYLVFGVQVVFFFIWLLLDVTVPTPWPPFAVAWFFYVISGVYEWSFIAYHLRYYKFKGDSIVARFLLINGMIVLQHAIVYGALINTLDASFVGLDTDVEWFTQVTTAMSTAVGGLGTISAGSNAAENNWIKWVMMVNTVQLYLMNSIILLKTLQPLLEAVGDVLKRQNRQSMTEMFEERE